MDDLLIRLLSATSERQKVLAANIANQNVPGYKRQELEFEGLLRHELERGASDFGRIEPKLVIDHETPGRADGNNVFIEDEVTAMRENRLLYELYATVLSGRMKMLGSAIHGDR
jgi:flagellar basal-body rod protein FlgB